MQQTHENPLGLPVFLEKLWIMVNDPSADHLIHWNPSGTSFVIPSQAQFWCELLPSYYKHNNMGSFVRQLNMYGFHKKSTMEGSKDEVEFSHPLFCKNHPELLKDIKRKATKSRTIDENNKKGHEIMEVVTNMKELNHKQESISKQLETMEKENAMLWREIGLLRQKQLEQRKVITNMTKFLVKFVNTSSKQIGRKRECELTLYHENVKKIKLSNGSINAVNTINELNEEKAFASNRLNNQSNVNNPEQCKPYNEYRQHEYNACGSNLDIEVSDNQLNQLRDILDECKSADMKALLDLFNGDGTLCDVNINSDKTENTTEFADPVICNFTSTTYAENPIINDVRISTQEDVNNPEEADLTEDKIRNQIDFEIF